MERLKVLLVNGSPHKEGCVFTALTEIATTLKDEGVDSTLFCVGNQPVAGCIGCGACVGKRRCFRNDRVNEFVEMMDDYDGFVFGTPVHYAAASGAMTSFLDRVFFIDEFNGDHFAGKPAAAIATCRRSGGTAALDQMNKYMTDCNMPIVPSQYWDVVHGNTPDEIRRDTEGLQTMRVLARNMAWLLKCIALGREHGIGFPTHEQHTMTNFIR
ncbi:flavodoxin family protein [Parabacteroides distasonis]|uniref:flavodoxin family protein n=1 Tax=Parabacteroides distasonis TaxID=823 RepID=UPI003F250464